LTKAAVAPKPVAPKPTTPSAAPVAAPTNGGRPAPHTTEAAKAAAPSAPNPDDVPPPEPEVPVGIVDPHGIGPVVSRLSTGSLRTGRVALGIMSALLDDGEQVEALVQGVYQNQIAVGALTSKRVLLVNEHEWVPFVRSIPLSKDLLVQGWQDDRTASLIFIVDEKSITISSIADRPLAQDLAHRMRAKVAAL